MIELHDGSMLQSDAIEESVMPKIETEYYLGELERLGWAKREFRPEFGDDAYVFTHEGRAALIESKKNGPH